MCKTEGRNTVRKIVSEILNRIAAIPDRERILIAIDGSCTSGKSTLAELLTRELCGYAQYKDKVRYRMIPFIG